MTVSVTKVVASVAALTAVVTLSDGTRHVLGFSDFNDAKPDIIKDAVSGELSDYLSTIPTEFLDSAEEIEVALTAADDFEVIYEAAA